MKSYIIFLFSLLATATTSIAQLDPKTPFEEPKTFKEKSYNFFLSKRLKRAIHQRDSLNDLVIAFNKDTAERGRNYRYLDSVFRELTSRYNECTEKNNALKSQYAELNAKYNELMKKSMSEAERLNNALKIKSEELTQKSDELEKQRKLLEQRERRLAELEATLRAKDSITNAINDLVKKALLGFNSDEISVEMKNGKVYVSLSDKLLFKSGSAEVEDKGKQALKKLSEVLNKNNEIDVEIEGHTDNIPIKTARYEDNWDLSVHRATNIVRILQEEYAVNAKRLTAAGKGEFMPKASNETAEGRAKNRRTEIVLSPKLDELFKLINKK